MTPVQERITQENKIIADKNNAIKMLRSKIRNLQVVKSQVGPSMNLNDDSPSKNQEWRYIKETGTPEGEKKIFHSEDRQTPSVGPKLNLKMDASEQDHMNSSSGMTPRVDDSIEIKGELNPAFSKPDFRIKEDEDN